MQLLYDILAVILVILATPVFIYRTIREEGFGQRLRQSLLGFIPEDTLAKVSGKGCIWVHAASVGEIVAASPIVKEIKKELPGVPILISAVTDSGYVMAKRIIPDADAIIFFPLDLPWLCRQVVTRVQPRAFLPVETELWPNFLRAIRYYSVPVMMVNGRISDKSVDRYHYLGSILKKMLGSVHLFCMQSTIDAQYIIRLGADPRRVVVTGNTKYDQTYTDVSPEEREKLAEELGLASRSPVIVAGSTHKGEEEYLFAAFNEIKEAFPNAGMIIAPRDILRTSEIQATASQYGITTARRTELTGQSEKTVHNTVILDTIGELGRIYSLGDINYVGGSLVPHGGHNILEPAAQGKPILVGPHMFNFKDIYALLSGRGACDTVYEPAELGPKIVEILRDPDIKARMGQQALAIIQENRGAAQKSAWHLKELLTKRTPNFK